jgi:hypothetical protein
VIAVWRLVLPMLTVLRERDRGRGSERERDDESSLHP